MQSYKVAVLFVSAIFCIIILTYKSEKTIFCPGDQIKPYFKMVNSLFDTKIYWKRPNIEKTQWVTFSGSGMSKDADGPFITSCITEKESSTCEMRGKKYSVFELVNFKNMEYRVDSSNGYLRFSQRCFHIAE